MVIGIKLLATCDVGVSKTHPLVHVYSMVMTQDTLLCIPVTEFVSCAFSPIPACPNFYVLDNVYYLSRQLSDVAKHIIAQRFGFSAFFRCNEWQNLAVSYLDK